MKRLAAILLAGLIVTSGVAAVASGGTAADPLISQSYITGTYQPAVMEQVSDRINTLTAKTYDDAQARLKAQAELYLARVGDPSGAGAYADSFQEGRYKRGDVITVDAGSGLLLLAGSAVLSYQSGAALDLTAGTAVASGTAMVAQRRYLAAEQTYLRATITSDTAVLAAQGYYTLTASGEIDYNELATALGTMGLFQGTGTAYGSGYDLERIPTRIEGIVLFLRLIGEEKAALAHSGASPFGDVPEWGKRYVAYAFEKGYTKGVDEEYMLFGSNNVISSGEYLTFLLRALGYRDSGASPDFTWETAIERGKALGVITEGESELLAGGRPFLRAQVAYLSYYTLEANRRSGGTLQSYLISTGMLKLNQVNTARSAVTGKRIS